MPEDAGRNSRVAVENSVMRVLLADVEDASGRQVHDYMIVESRRNGGRTPSGIVVVPVVDGRVAMLRVFRPPIGRAGWELPRGFIDETEAPSAAASRELAEETGLKCSPDELVSLGEIAPEPGVIRALHPVFLAVCDGQVVDWIQHDFGHLAFAMFSRTEIMSMIRHGEIVDSNTVSALFLWRSHDKGQEW